MADLRASTYLSGFAALYGITELSPEFHVTLEGGHIVGLASAHRITPMRDDVFDPAKVYRVRVLAIDKEGR